MVLIKIEIRPKGKNGSLAASFNLRTSPRYIRPCTFVQYSFAFRVFEHTSTLSPKHTPLQNSPYLSFGKIMANQTVLNDRNALIGPQLIKLHKRLFPEQNAK